MPACVALVGVFKVITLSVLVPNVAAGVDQLFCSRRGHFLFEACSKVRGRLRDTRSEAGVAADRRNSETALTNAIPESLRVC